MTNDNTQFLGIKSLILSACEEACNRSLNYDESSRQRLAQLHNKTVAIDTFLATPLGELSFQFYIHFYDSGLIFSVLNENKVDATIQASSFQLVIQMIKQQALQENPNILLSGDEALISELEDILTHMDIDWEEPLSHITGDIIAHEISKAGKTFFGWLKRTTNTRF